VLAAVRRKQIPVCRTCHRKIHGGEYDGVRLKDLFNPNFAYPTQ
jgi:hypothetical protein